MPILKLTEGEAHCLYNYFLNSSSTYTEEDYRGMLGKLTAMRDEKLIGGKPQADKIWRALKDAAGR